jgi:hypothetical protein
MSLEEAWEHSPCSPKSPQQKPFCNLRQIASNGSVSTMAPDDASECGSIMRRMPHVSSSGSVNTMLSDWNLAEDEEIEFELDIEAGAAAARQHLKPPGVFGPPARHVAPIVFGAERGKTTPEMSHSQVPRSQDMTEMFNSSKHEEPTTMMIRNIPGRYTQNDLMLDLKDLGLAGTYDFLYMPVDKATSANVGYSFVNFVDPAWATMCLKVFEHFRFTRHQQSSKKMASVSVAHLQGLEKNLQHYENTAVNISKEKRRRPVIMANIAKMLV